MPSYAVNRVLSYPPEKIFDLVADAERYPEFLPWWVAARIEERDGDSYYTDQVIGFRGFVLERFRSRTNLDRPGRIDVTSQDGPFRHLALRWEFEPTPDAGCRVAFRVDFELRSGLVQRLFAPLFNGAVRRVLDAFEKRARRLYGPPQPTSGSRSRRS